MYAGFFELREPPFNNTPDPRFFFSTPDHEEAVASLIYAVQARKGFVLLTGEIGAGKTLASRLTLRHFGSNIAFASVTHAVPDGRDLLESVCAEFELEIASGASATAMVRALHDFLLAKFSQDIAVVLVLDEAQNLSCEAFEQLRMIGNLEADDAKLLQICIVGQPELREMFASRELRQLRQRLYRCYHLPALTRALTSGYIRHRWLTAGGSSTCAFTSEAMNCVFEYSRGLPRVINAVCDNALLSAYAVDRRSIDGAFMRGVIEQMMPESASAAATQSIGVSADASLVRPRHLGTRRNSAPKVEKNQSAGTRTHRGGEVARASSATRRRADKIKTSSELIADIRFELGRLRDRIGLRQAGAIVPASRGRGEKAGQRRADAEGLHDRSLSMDDAVMTTGGARAPRHLTAAPDAGARI